MDALVGRQQERYLASMDTLVDGRQTCSVTESQLELGNSSKPGLVAS